MSDWNKNNSLSSCYDPLHIDYNNFKIREKKFLEVFSKNSPTYLPTLLLIPITRSPYKIFPPDNLHYTRGSVFYSFPIITFHISINLKNSHFHVSPKYGPISPQFTLKSSLQCSVHSSSGYVFYALDQMKSPST